jgi:hypothetical protein
MPCIGNASGLLRRHDPINIKVAAAVQYDRPLAGYSAIPATRFDLASVLSKRSTLAAGMAAIMPNEQDWLFVAGSAGHAEGDIERRKQSSNGWNRCGSTISQTAKMILPLAPSSPRCSIPPTTSTPGVARMVRRTRRGTTEAPRD